MLDIERSREIYTYRANKWLVPAGEPADGMICRSSVGLALGIGKLLPRKSVRFDCLSASPAVVWKRHIVAKQVCRSTTLVLLVLVLIRLLCNEESVYLSMREKKYCRMTCYFLHKSYNSYNSVGVSQVAIQYSCKKLVVWFGKKRVVEGMYTASWPALL